MTVHSEPLKSVHHVKIISICIESFEILRFGHNVAVVIQSFDIDNTSSFLLYAVVDQSQLEPKMLSPFMKHWVVDQFNSGLVVGMYHKCNVTTIYNLLV